MPSAVLKACAATLVGLTSLAAAPVVSAQPSAQGEVAGICRGVLGLEPGEKHYAACTDSLGRSLQDLDQGRGMAAARRECLARRLAPDTSAFAECELAASQEAARPVRDDGATVIPGGTRSYFMISRETAYRRDQLACARLGLDPDQGAFGSCVADLKTALARASEPAM